MEAKTITIANRLNRTDSVTGLDVWYKTELHNITYSKERVTDVNGTQVSVGEVFTILIPFDKYYKPYIEWKKLADKDDFYTLSQGDYIFLTQVEEDIQPNNIMTLNNSYKPLVCEVRSIIEVSHKHGATIRLKVSGV